MKMIKGSRSSPPFSTISIVISHLLFLFSVNPSEQCNTLFSNVPWPYSVNKGFCYNLHQTALKWPLRQYLAPKILRNKSRHNLSTVLSSLHTLVRCWRNKEKPGLEENTRTWRRSSLDLGCLNLSSVWSEEADYNLVLHTGEPLATFVL